MSLAKAAAFIAQTPARVVVVPMWTANADEWAAFGMAIKAFADLLFIAAAGDEGRDIDRAPVWPAAFAHAQRAGGERTAGGRGRAGYTSKYRGQ